MLQDSERAVRGWVLVVDGADCMFTRLCMRVILPVKEDPLADCRDGVLRFIERRELRLQAVLCKGHDEGITR